MRVILVVRLNFTKSIPLKNSKRQKEKEKQIIYVNAVILNIVMNALNQK